MTGRNRIAVPCSCVAVQDEIMPAAEMPHDR